MFSIRRMIFDIFHFIFILIGMSIFCYLIKMIKLIYCYFTKIIMRTHNTCNVHQIV